MKRLYSDMFSKADGPRPRSVNSARYVFLDPGAREVNAGWDRASDVGDVLRSAAGRDPLDRNLSDLVCELSTRCGEFRTRWAAHNARFHDIGTKGLPPCGRRRHHPRLTTAWKSRPTPA